MRQRGPVLGAALLLALPGSAAAQRPRCGYGEAMVALHSAATTLARPVTSLTEGRVQAGAAQAELRTATTTLQGCGCRRAADDAGEASMLAETAAMEPSAMRIATRLERAGFSLRLVRERLGRDGCS